MYAYRVYVFHRAYGDAVALGVTHYLELYLFPARYALLDEHLSDRRQIKSVACYLTKFFFGVYYTAACAAECECGADDQRVAHSLAVSESYSVLNGVYDL